jgi:hypothetical protein
VFGDLTVRQPGRHKPDDFALPIGQRFEAASRARPLVPGHERGDQASCDARGEQRVTAGHGPNAAQEIQRLGVLDEEAARTQSERLEYILVEIEGGEDDGPDLGQLLVRNAITTNPIVRAAQATARRPAVAAVKMATATATRTGPRAYPRSQKSSADASATQSATTGYRRRTASTAAPEARRAIPAASSDLRSGCVSAARCVPRIAKAPIASARATSVHKWRLALAHHSVSRPAVAIIACPSST